MNYKWKSEYESGIKEIDEWHKTICRLTNEVNEDTQQDEIISIIQFIVQNLDHHLATEEMYMERFNYPKLKEHKESHLEVKRNYHKLLLEMSKTSAKKIIPQVKSMLINWVQEHIDSQDLELINFFKNHTELSQKKLATHCP